MATQLDTDMTGWADGTRHYKTATGWVAVEASTPESPVPVGAEPMIGELLTVIGEGRAALKHVVRPTVIFECTEHGEPINLTPLYTFPPGTTHEDALQQAGL